MPSRDFFKTLRDSLNEIVNGDEQKGLSEGQKHRQNSAQNEIESAVIVLATEVMRLDGNSSNETQKMLLDFLEKNFGKISSSKRNKLIKDHLFVGPQAFTKMACEQIKTLTTHGSKLEIVKLLYEIATYDDFIRSKENSTIQKIARYLEISIEELRTIKEKFARINDPFIVLEMEETVSIIKVKAAYRKVVLKYHPDKRTEIVTEEEANRKFREIKKAYELIMKKIKSQP